ncbi:MAG: lamin tail domain-containing protein, partial [Deltaproteobacteria bacterium]|nr:lamin tail domain-containing protein [Deltaproteobacteria bacterium]
MRGLVLLAGATSLLGAACGPDPVTGDCSDELLAGDVVITEVFADSKAPPGGSGTDEGKEWFEVYNASDRPIELAGMTIVHSRVGGTPKSHVIKDVTVGPGQFFTLGNSADDLLPAYVDYGYGADLGDLFNTDGGRLALSCGKSEIDAATYENVKEGRSRQLTAAQPPDYTLNDDPLSWCEANGSEFDTGNFGTPGSDNDCTPVVIGQCTDNGTMRDAVLPVVGDLIITEVMPNPAAVADGEGEWFEILAINGFDLNGVGIDRAGDTSNPTVISSPTCIHVNAGSYVLFAQNDNMAMNGGLPAGTIAATFSFALIDGTTAAPGDVRVMAGTNVIDAVTWT